MPTNEKSNVIKRPDLTPALEQSGLELVAEQTLQLEQLTVEEVIQKLRSVLPETSSLHETEDFIALLKGYIAPELKTIDIVAISPKQYKTTDELLKFAKDNDLRPATIAEYLQYLINNLKLNGKLYLATLDIQQVSSEFISPIVFWRGPVLKLRAEDSSLRWLGHGALLFVRE